MKVMIDEQAHAAGRHPVEFGWHCSAIIRGMQQY
jgi:hypothetical protein